MPAEKTDYAAGAALALFPMLYGGALIGYAIASRPAPRYDIFGQPVPELLGKGSRILQSQRSLPSWLM